MLWSIVAASAPFAALGIQLALNPDKKADYYEKQMQKGRNAIWHDKFRHELGKLICELDNQTDLLSHLEERREIIELEEETVYAELPMPDYSERIGGEIPFIPAITSITDNIREHAEKISELEECNDNLPFHRERIGWSLIIAAISVDIVAVLYSKLKLISPEAAALTAGFMVVIGCFYVGRHYRQLRKKRNEIVESAPIDGHEGGDS